MSANGRYGVCRHCGRRIAQGKNWKIWRELLVVQSPLEALYMCQSGDNVDPYNRHEPF